MQLSCDNADQYIDSCINTAQNRNSYVMTKANWQLNFSAHCLVTPLIKYFVVQTVVFCCGNFILCSFFAQVSRSASPH